MVRADGYNQTRNVGTVLEEHLVVRIEDDYNNPVSGIQVSFQVTDGKGGGYVIENQPVLSDSNGEAKVQYVLGDESGTNLIEASSGTLIGSPVFFSENGEVNAADSLKRISGNDQFGTAGTTLSDPLIVQVLDQNSNPVKNVPVTFSITLGGGQVSQPQPVLTDAFGNAETMFTLGQSIGQHIAKAESPGLQNSPILFLATSNFAPAHELVLVSGDNQTGVVNSFGAPLKVQVLDEMGNPVEGYPVTFNVVSGDVSITNPQPDTSDLSGFASANIQFGSTSGDAVIQAQTSSLQGSPVVFNLTIDPEIASIIELEGGNNQRGSVGYELILPLTVRIQDNLGNPVSGDSVIFVVMQGGASIVGYETKASDIEGYASCRIKLGPTPGNIIVLAIAPLLSGSPITFNATAVINNLPSITADWNQATIEETQAISFNVTGSDPDSDPLEFDVANMPSGASLDSIDAFTRKFDWTPDYTHAGVHSIVFSVLDGNGGIDRDTVTINVINKNRKPTITLFEPIASTFSVEQGAGSFFMIQAQDPDLEQIAYFWTKNSVKVANGDSYNYSSDPEFTGTDFVVGFATDGIDTVSHEWTVTVISAIELESFLATPSTETVGVELSWVTQIENGNLGFNLYRSLRKDGKYIKINKEFVQTNNTGSYTYFDDQVEAGLRYYYKLEDVSVYGTRTMHGPVVAEVRLPKTFTLELNYPNPFNPETTIKFQVPERVHVYIGIFNILGQEVKVLFDKEVAAGYHSVKWNGQDNYNDFVTSGIYYYRIQTESYTALKKMIFLK